MNFSWRRAWVQWRREGAAEAVAVSTSSLLATRTLPPRPSSSGLLRSTHILISLSILNRRLSTGLFHFFIWSQPCLQKYFFFCTTPASEHLISIQFKLSTNLKKHTASKCLPTLENLPLTVSSRQLFFCHLSFFTWSNLSTHCSAKLIWLSSTALIDFSLVLYRQK